MDIGHLQEPSVAETFYESFSVMLEELGATGRLQVLWEGFRDSVLEFDSESVPDVPIRQQAALSQEMVDVFYEWSKARLCEAIRLGVWHHEERIRGLCEAVEVNSAKSDAQPVYKAIRVVHPSGPRPRNSTFLAADDSALSEEDGLKCFSEYFDELYRAEYPHYELSIEDTANFVFSFEERSGLAGG